MGMMRILDQLLQVQRGHLLAWGPVFLGLGIGVYFAVPVEPGALTYLSVATLVGVGGLSVLHASAIGLLGRALLIALIGFSVAGLRSHWLEAPVLSFRYYGPVEGRLVQIDRSARDLMRLTLDQLRLTDVPGPKTPERVRITLLTDAALPPVGARVATTAHLMPPQGPVEPGGFDFRRYAWFMQLGASGYTRVPVLMVDAQPPEMSLEGLRRDIALGLRQRLHGASGAIAAAITTGDRSGVSQETLQDLRASNLAHLLAISGLHMGLVAGFVFAVLRFGLCLVPALALRINVKKWAAAVALLAAFGYLALSGGNVATERAFIMVLVMLGAVLIDRRAISLRAVAVAAVVVLLRRPEALLSPGFQMSFAATAALVGVFSGIRDRGYSLGPSWLRPIVGLCLSSLVAGLATAPFGAAHFNTLSHYGLLANLLAVPVMGLIVVPAAVAALMLLPLGAEELALTVMAAGLDWILAVASHVAALPGADRSILQPDPLVLPLITGGGLFLLIWQGRLRVAGVLPILVAGLLWSQSHRPAALISPEAGLVGVLGPDGRMLSREKAKGFAAKVWLENDGDRSSQKAAHARTPTEPSRPWQASVGSFRMYHLVGKGAAAQVVGCTADEILVSTVDLKIDGPCLVLDPQRMRETGSIRIEADGTLVTAADLAGRRLWTGPQAGAKVRN
ncbi:ComEC/Rec2 family competence protein [Phaeobacter sp. QD34_3]|uniref:ComEC/Rec2 family competence protein n=1 Tax=unclassified Phaeobacter TaxID=2621772 RepID=UPI00237F611B|nr:MULTISPECIES: ComEC/Rec2 family competence protein [unclassified Phaeobacter]MDE4131654.1 ComEC/Rec2 family competence protein [Phaeobacter sp. QD34_3]MDE4135257.1 ComEC/Rec2 family competence protein [Phaeobacter sp. QD34_24]